MGLAVIREDTTMTSEEFKKAGQAFQLRLTGKTHGWQTTIAHQIIRSTRTVRRYADGSSEIPEPVAQRVRQLAEQR